MRLTATAAEGPGMPLCHLLLVVPLLGLATPAAANAWKFVGGGGDAKFGFEPRGFNNFDPIWFRCEEGRIRVSAAIGQRRPAGGRGRATLAAGGQSATIEGEVPDEEFEGLYSIDTAIGRDHPVLALLGAGGAVTFQPAGGGRQSLGGRGLKDALSRFLSACS